jgi:glycosyltransferase involved in cell wall biosynthesis
MSGRRTARRRRLVIANWRDGAHPLAGGAELYCERVAEELGAAGADVVLLTSRPGRLPRREARGSYEVVRAGGTYTVYARALLWLLLHRRSVDAVVDSQNGVPFFSPLVVGRRTPVLLLLHHVHQEQFSARFGPLTARVGRWLEGPASRLVYRRRALLAVSPSTRTDARRLLRLRGPLSVVPCGMDAPPARAAARSATPRIVVVGRLVAHKRLHLLLDAVAEVAATEPRVELHVVGDGPARADLEARAADAGVAARTVFHGRLPDDERDALLASAWLTVSASAGEGWGLSVLEANAAGVPAVAFRVSGLRDAIRHGRTGWLVDPAAPLGPAVRDALAELAAPEAAHRWARAARSWASHFSWERTAAGVRSAVELERSRLRLSQRERRLANDATSVVEVPARLLHDGWEELLRWADTWSATGTTVRCLLRGADEDDAVRALRRLRVDVADPAVRVLVARPADLLGEPADWLAEERPASSPAGPGAGR